MGVAVAVRECDGCGQDFEQERRRGRPRSYCLTCRPPNDAPVPVEAREAWVSQLGQLAEEAEALDREAGQLEAAAKVKRAEAAKTRARADRLAGAVEGVTVRRQPSALDRVRDDGLLAAAGLASEDLPVGFTARDLAAALGIVDVARASRLLSALLELEKVLPYGDGFMTVDEDEHAVRDYIVTAGAFTFEEAMAALGLPVAALDFYLARFEERGTVETAGVGFRYVERGPNDAPRSRPRRRPPELDPPAGTDAPKRGEAVRIVDHGQGAAPGGRHRMKLKQAAWDRQQAAKEEQAEKARRRAANGNGRRR